MKKEELLAQAQELNIKVPDGATNKEIGDLIKIADYPRLEKKLSTVESELESTLVKVQELENSQKKSITKATGKKVVYKSTDGTFEFSINHLRHWSLSGIRSRSWEDFPILRYVVSEGMTVETLFLPVKN